MNIIAMAFIAIGYALFYWGANEIKHWNKSVQDTEAATFKLLVGFPMPSDYKSIHSVPFVFTDPSATTPSTPGTSPNPGTSIDPSKPSAPQNGLSPNFPGGPGATIPTPGIPGVSNL